MDLIADFTIDNQKNIDLTIYGNKSDEEIRNLIDKLIEEKRDIPENTEVTMVMTKKEIFLSFDDETEDIILNRIEYSF